MRYKLKGFCLLLFILLTIITIDLMAASKPTGLVLAIKGESTEGYDPTIGWGRYGSPLFHSTLLRRDENLNIVNDLATDYSISKDGLTWYVSIRMDVKFSDGRPLTAEDVAFTFLQTKTAGGKVDLTFLKDVKQNGKYSLEFHLKTPSIVFVNRLITLGIVPKHAYSEHYGRHPIGSGPFKLLHWQEGHQLIVESNPLYYGEKPTFQKITFLFTDEDTSFAAAKAGGIHVVAVPQILAGQNVKGMSLHPVKSVDNRGIMFPMVPNTGKKTADGYPIGNNVTADIYIRKAANVVLDRKALVDGILEGYGTAAHSVSDNLPWGTEAGRLKDADVSGAREILKKGGWVDKDNDGFVEKAGLTAEFDLVYPSSDSIRQSLALASADMLGTIGIKANVIGKSWDEISTLRHSCAILFGWGSHDPTELYNLFYSKKAGSGSYNAGYYNNKTVDRYLDQAMASHTFDESLKYWKMAQWDGTTGISARGDAPWAWLVNLTHTYFVDNCLDVGKSQVEPHGHGWPITANIVQWKWTCSK